MPIIVQTERLTKRFGDFTALNPCSLTIDSGEVFGLLGPNGAGKTTLIRLLLGYLRPTAGTATIDGRDCYADRVHVHRDLSYLPGDARLPKAMSGRQILKFFTSVRPDSSMKRAIQIAERLDLDLSRWVAFMSTGMRQKLALAIVMAVDCRLWILDEPTANLDPTVRGEVLSMVAQAQADGRTVIFSSHVLSEIEDVCSRVGILRSGSLAFLQPIDGQIRQRICGVLTGPVTDPPAHLLHHADWWAAEGRCVLTATGDLTPWLHWLSSQPITEMRLETAGLREIYDRVQGVEGEMPLQPGSSVELRADKEFK